MPLFFLPSAASSHSYATFNPVFSPAPPIPHLTSVAMPNRHCVQIQMRKDWPVTPHKAHCSPAPFEPADVDLVAINEQTSSLPLRMWTLL